MLHVQKIMLYIDINKPQWNIILLHFYTIYLACERSMTPYIYQMHPNIFKVFNSSCAQYNFIMIVRNIDLNTYQGKLNIKKVWNSKFSGIPNELFSSMCFYNRVQCPQLLSRVTFQTCIFIRLVQILKQKIQTIFLDLMTREVINNYRRRYKSSAIVF